MFLQCLLSQYIDLINEHNLYKCFNLKTQWPDINLILRFTWVHDIGFIQGLLSYYTNVLFISSNLT